eukprot:Mycagemm_TRINITY_DN8816_c0_g1::TRINITY_DN8816_c0_g1_i1::g.1882::m.1882 type:complete len:138 gc:universal TRINITY_DN8816_c0_g1_i1:829-416(-)
MDGEPTSLADVHSVVLRRDASIQLRVNVPNVVAFHVVVYVGLPVARNRLEPVLPRLHAIETEGLNDGCQVGKLIADRLRMHVQVAEYQALPRLHPRRQKGEVSGVRRLRPEFWCPPQPSICVVDPTMVLAPDYVAPP